MFEKLKAWVNRLYKDAKTDTTLDTSRSLLPSGVRAVRIPEVRCPICKHKLDMATAVGDNVEQKVGDIGVCHFCGGVLEVEAGGLIEIRGETWDTVPRHLKEQIMRVSSMAIGVSQGRRPNPVEMFGALEEIE